MLASCKRQGLNPAVAVRDGGAATAAGLARLFPEAEQRGDSRNAGQYIERRLKGLTSYADRVHAELELLAEEFGQEAVVSAMVVLHLAGRMKRWRTSSAKRERLEQLKTARAALEATGRGDDVLSAVHPVFYRRHRASTSMGPVQVDLGLGAADGATGRRLANASRRRASALTGPQIWRRFAARFPSGGRAFCVAQVVGNWEFGIGPRVRVARGAVP